jgi:hypothetical protein
MDEQQGSGFFKVVAGVLLAVIALMVAVYVMRLLYSLLFMAVVVLAIVGVGALGYQAAKMMMGGADKDKEALPGESAREEQIKFDFEDEDDALVRELKKLEAQERRRGR